METTLQAGINEKENVMRILYIDIETTGLNAETDQILEFAAVLDEFPIKEPDVEKLPRFRHLFKYDRVTGDPYALQMNAGLLLEMSKAAAPRPAAAARLMDWLVLNGAAALNKITLCGLCSAVLLVLAMAWDIFIN